MIDIELTFLGNRELYALGVRVEEIIGKYDAAALGFQLLAGKFKLQLAEFKVSVKKQQASAGQVAEKDRRRDNYFNALHNHVSNFRYHPDPVKIRQSKELHKVLSRKGSKICENSYRVESAALGAMFSTIDGIMKPMIQNLGASEWYRLLRGAQNDFEATVHEIAGEQGDSDKVLSASKKRAGLEDALHKLFMFLPLQYEITESRELGKLIAELQEEVDRL